MVDSAPEQGQLKNKVRTTGLLLQKLKKQRRDPPDEQAGKLKGVSHSRKLVGEITEFYSGLQSNNAGMIRLAGGMTDLTVISNTSSSPLSPSSNHQPLLQSALTVLQPPTPAPVRTSCAPATNPCSSRTSCAPGKVQKKCKKSTKNQ